MTNGTGRASALAAAVVAAVIAASPAAAQQPAPQWELSYNQEARYFSWQGNRGYPAPGINTLTSAPGSGWQFYTPATFAATGTTPDVIKFEFVGRGGYVDSKQTTPGATGGVSTYTDTLVSGTWTYLGMPGIQPFLTLNANVPTGRTLLTGTAAFARMDPDLVDLPTFGEGWNFGPSVGFNLAVSQNVIFSSGVGYTVRGHYDRDNFTPIGGVGVTTLDPGDVLSVNATIGFRSGPLFARLTGIYSHESTTTFDGVPSFHLGDRFAVSGFGGYAWSKDSITRLIASWNYYQKNKVFSTPPPTLMMEAFNSNSSVYRIRLEHTFVFGQWSAGPSVGYLVRDNNTYSPTDLLFVPAKTRWSAGGNLSYSVDNKTQFYGSVERVWIEEGQRSAPAISLPPLNYTGWMVIAGGSLQF